MNRIIAILFLILFFAASVNAEEILLSNGDKITGKVMKEDEKTITLHTEALGQIVVDKSYLKVDLASEEAEESATNIEKKVSLGYSQSGGNTEASEFSGEISYSAKTDHDEWTGKLTGFYSSSNKQMDARKFYGMLRYAYSFGEYLKWYNFYKIEGDQDRFADIDYRLVPSTGVGYWFSDKDDFKALVEAGAGYEYTYYRQEKDAEGNTLLVARGFMEKQLSENSKISENITFYPSLEELDSFRFSSESSFENKLSENTFWKLSFVDDYNSNARGSIKKNDYRLITSLGINF